LPPRPAGRRGRKWAGAAGERGGRRGQNASEDGREQAVPGKKFFCGMDNTE
jgi:hypothetical protein